MKLSIRLSNAGLAVLSGIITAFLLFGMLLLRPVPVSSSSTYRVEAREFVLRDSHGRERVRIAVEDDDSPGISLLDKSGTRRALLRLNGDDVPSLRMYNEGGTVDSVLGYNLMNMEPGLIFFNGQGTGHLAASPLDTLVSSSQPFFDEDLHRNWRSLLPSDIERQAQEWHSVHNTKPFQIQKTLEELPTPSEPEVEISNFRTLHIQTTP